MLKTGLVTTAILMAILQSSSSGAASIPGLQEVQTVDSASRDLAEGDSEEVREEFHQTYPLTANGRISLENINGGVRIGVWDRNEVQVDAVKRAYNRQRLNEAKIEVDATPDFIRIDTKYPEYNKNVSDEDETRYNNPAIVDYSIKAPRGVRLESVDLINGMLEIEGVEGNVKASSINGRVTARGLIGEARLSTVNGPVEAVFTRLDGAKPISLGSVNGPVVVVIPSDSNAIVRANTVHGGILNDFGLEVQHGEYVGHELYGQLGAGGTRIKLGNVNGRISIKHAQDGRQLSAATCLLTQKDKDKDKDRADKYDKDDDATKESRRVAREIRKQILSQVDAEKIARETKVETQREVERAIREAQREIERAQREVQRDTERQIREQIRNKVRSEGGGEGVGGGVGKGVGAGGRFIEKESKSFAVNGTPRVNIGTFDGSVVVRAWDKQEVMYSATKRAGTEQEVKQIFVDGQQRGSGISIVARSPQGEGTVSLEVYLPRSTDVHVSTGDGRLSIEGVSGDITLRTSDGSIHVNNSRGQLQVNTGDGSIHVAGFEGQVDARTGDGSIFMDGNFTGLAARTGSGSISLSVPAGSNFTLETNADDAISNEGLTISEDIAPSKRVKRWKIGSGGNVFVVNTGEGKIILKPR